jgi:hypothetical protein
MHASNPDVSAGLICLKTTPVKTALNGNLCLLSVVPNNEAAGLQPTRSKYKTSHSLANLLTSDTYTSSSHSNVEAMPGIPIIQLPMLWVH